MGTFHNQCTMCQTHQFGIVLIGMYRLAEVDELIVVVERGNIYPQTAEIDVVVFGVCATIDARLAAKQRLSPRR